jgi:hypothetical protein
MSSIRNRFHRQFLSASGDSWASNLRDKRNREFIRRFPDLSMMNVIDLGGTVQWWINFPVRPHTVKVVNLEIEETHTSGITTHRGDACSVDVDELGSFDLVFSNSLIEHVGGADRRLALSQVVRKLANKWWIQTPYRYFPIEPHWVFPGQQWLPLAARARIARHWHFGHMQSDSYHQAVSDCLNTELISKTEMSFLFNDSEIWPEKFMGLTKSLVAIRY